MDETLAEGFRVLAAIAAGADAPAAIAAHLHVDAARVASHLDRLVAAGFVRRNADRVALADRATQLLDDLVGRSDLLAIAAPVVLEAEIRLGVRIEIAVVPEADPEAIVGGSPFAVIDGPAGRTVVAPVLDTTGQIACVLRVAVDGLAPEALEVLGRELLATCREVSALLPRAKDRSVS